MEITGPDTFTLDIKDNAFVVTCSKGTNKFSGLSCGSLPKLYIITAGEGVPIYVGISRQAIRNRLRFGFTAMGKGGYHGYKWRHDHEQVKLHLWYHMDGKTDLDLETVEAEIVFLIRQRGQWPLFQTEIHFHPSTQVHRDVAQKIMDHFPASLQLHPHNSPYQNG